LILSSKKESDKVVTAPNFDSQAYRSPSLSMLHFTFDADDFQADVGPILSAKALIRLKEKGLTTL
jgi:hypothetical protein